MTIENQIKLLIAEILEDTDNEKLFLLDTIFPKAMKIHNTLNDQATATHDDYLALNSAIAELVSAEIERFNALEQFGGCHILLHSPCKEH